MLIHYSTIIQTVIAQIDEDGNVIAKQPLQIEVARLDEAEFAEACKRILEAKAQIEAQAHAVTPAEEAV